MRTPTLAALAILGIAGTFGLVGCAPAASVPTPTASIDPTSEAVSTAEATYRAYIEALNAVDLADPRTFDPVLHWLSGDSLKSSRKAFRQMHDAGLRVSGDSIVGWISVLDSSKGRVDAQVCLDVSEVTVVTADGEPVKSPSRLDRQPLRVRFSAGETATGLTISSSNPEENPECH